MPLMRPAQRRSLAPPSCDAALDRIAAEVRRVQAAHGPDAWRYSAAG